MALWKKVAPMIDSDIRGCDQILDDYNRIKNYEQEVFARSDAKEYIKGMIEKNKEWIEGAEAAKIENWKESKYFESGKFAAMSAYYMGIAPQ